MGENEGAHGRGDSSQPLPRQGRQAGPPAAPSTRAAPLARLSGFFAADSDESLCSVTGTGPRPDRTAQAVLAPHSTRPQTPSHPSPGPGSSDTHAR